MAVRLPHSVCILCSSGGLDLCLAEKMAALHHQVPVAIAQVSDELRKVGGRLVDDGHDVSGHASGFLAKTFLEERAREAGVGVRVPHVFVEFALVGVEDEGPSVPVTLNVHEASEFLVHGWMRVSERVEAVL